MFEIVFIYWTELFEIELFIYIKMDLGLITYNGWCAIKPMAASKNSLTVEQTLICSNISLNSLRPRSISIIFITLVHPYIVFFTYPSLSSYTYLFTISPHLIVTLCCIVANLTLHRVNLSRKKIPSQWDLVILCYIGLRWSSLGKQWYCNLISIFSLLDRCVQ